MPKGSAAVFTFTVTDSMSGAAMLPTPLKVGVESFVRVPSAGVTRLTTGTWASTTQLWLAGVGSTLPAVSTARTSKVWEPSPRPV